MSETINVHGLDVLVEERKTQSNAGLQVFMFKATCGESIHEHTWTIGVGRRNDPPSIDKLRAELLTQRNIAADQAARKEMMRTMAGSL